MIDAQRLNLLKKQQQNLAIKVKTELAIRQQYLDKIAKKNAELQQIEESLKLLDETIAFLSVLITTARNEVYGNLVKTINFGIQEIFGLETEFKIESDLRGNTPVCKFFVKTKEFPEFVELDQGQEQHGGALCEIIGFLLQIVIYKISNCKFNTFVMDERFRQVAADKIEILGTLLHKLHEVFGLQFIIITHDELLAAQADKIIEIK